MLARAVLSQAVAFTSGQRAVQRGCAEPQCRYAILFGGTVPPRSRGFPLLQHYEKSVSASACVARASALSVCARVALCIIRVARYTPVRWAASILVRDKNGRSRKIFLALSTMSAPSASTVTQPRSSAAKAVLDRGRASLRLRPASSSSSSRFTTSCAPCRATTTARASAVRTSSLISQGLRVCQTISGIIYISLTATIAFDACDSPPFSLWSAHSAPPRTASSQTATR